MSALDLGQTTEAASSLPIDEARDGADRRFALSLRERRVLLAGLDFLVGAAASVIAYLLIHKPSANPLAPSLPLIMGGVWVVSLLISDGYAFQIPSRRAESALAVIKALPIAVLLMVTIFFIHPYVLSRPVIVGTIFIGALLLILDRTTAARLLLHESLAVRAVLVADTEPSAEIVSTLRAARFEYRVVGTFVHGVDDGNDGSALVMSVRKFLSRSRAEELIVTNHELRQLPGLVEECLNHGVRLVSAGDLVERYMGRVPIDSVDVHWFLGLPDRDVWKRPYALERRVMDLVLAIVLGVPYLIVLPVLALLIRLDTRGPILLTQRRIGEGGREFDLLKLRTMTLDAEADGAQYTSARDPRITRVGRWLRITRLDEFPQLLNILRGEMSFIGPRPERPEFIADLEATIPHFRSRLLIKPGLTGWAQIKGGYADSIAETTRKLEYDLYYIKNRSLRLDLQILSSTFITVLGRKGR